MPKYKRQMVNLTFYQSLREKHKYNLRKRQKEPERRVRAVIIFWWLLVGEHYTEVT